MNAYTALYQVLDWGPMLTQVTIPGNYPEADQFLIVCDKIDPETGKTAMVPTFFLGTETKPACGLVKVTEAAVAGDQTVLTPDYTPANPFSCLPYGKNTFTTFSEPQLKIFYKGELISDEGTWSIEKKELIQLSHPVSGISRAWTAPVSDGKQAPALIVWLHGAGEGGDDPYRSPLGNKAINMASPEIQQYFPGGAYVLYPECHTMWMDDGSGEYHAEGKTMYGVDLMHAITCFLEEHPDIDQNRIYVGGDSNGGFMTMRMIIDYPGFFAGAFPVCEALYDNTISDADILKIKDTPIWFTHAKNDPVVNPLQTAVATYDRLLKAGAANLHFSFYDNVIDKSGKFFKEDGTPFEYFGHGTWIYVYNNDPDFDFDGQPVLVNGKPATIFEWLGAQKKA